MFLDFRSNKSKPKNKLVDAYKNGQKWFWVRCKALTKDEHIILFNSKSLFSVSHVDFVFDGLGYQLNKDSNELNSQIVILILGKLNLADSGPLVYQLEATVIPDKNFSKLDIAVYQEEYQKVLQKYPQLWDLQ